MESVQKQISVMVAKSDIYRKYEVNNRKSVTVQGSSEVGYHGTKSFVKIVCFRDTLRELLICRSCKNEAEQITVQS